MSLFGLNAWGQRYASQELHRWGQDNERRRLETARLFEEFKRNNPYATYDEFRSFLDTQVGDDWMLRGNLPSDQVLRQLSDDNARKKALADETAGLEMMGKRLGAHKSIVDAIDMIAANHQNPEDVATEIRDMFGKDAQTNPMLASAFSQMLDPKFIRSRQEQIQQRQMLDLAAKLSSFTVTSDADIAHIESMLGPALQNPLAKAAWHAQRDKMKLEVDKHRETARHQQEYDALQQTKYRQDVLNSFFNPVNIDAYSGMPEKDLRKAIENHITSYSLSPTIQDVDSVMDRLYAYQNRNMQVQQSKQWDAVRAASGEKGRELAENISKRQSETMLGSVAATVGIKKEDQVARGTLASVAATYDMADVDAYDFARFVRDNSNQDSNPASLYGEYRQQRKLGPPTPISAHSMAEQYFHMNEPWKPEAAPAIVAKVKGKAEDFMSKIQVALEERDLALKGITNPQEKAEQERRHNARIKQMIDQNRGWADNLSANLTNPNLVLRGTGDLDRNALDGAMRDMQAARAQATQIISGRPDNMVIPGNIDSFRPVKNGDGSISTVDTITIGADGMFFVVPQVINGQRIPGGPEGAVKHFKETGRHLGAFETQQAADSYAQKLHLEHQQKYVTPQAQGQTPARAPGDYPFPTNQSVNVADAVTMPARVAAAPITSVANAINQRTQQMSRPSGQMANTILVEVPEIGAIGLVPLSYKGQQLDPDTARKMYEKGVIQALNYYPSIADAQAAQQGRK